jgi:hypothetical protein
MGKKRRVLRSPKFKHLRKHPKYAGMAAPKEQKIEEAQEIVEPVLEIVEPVLEIVEPVLETKPVATIEKPKPKPRRTRKTTAKKTTTRKRATIKKAEKKE